MMFPSKHLGVILATLGFLACLGPDSKLERFKTFTLPLTRGAEKGEAIRAMIYVGTLRRGDKIIIRTPSGEIAGSVSPFGIKAGQKAGIYPISIPPNAISGKTVTLRMEVVTSAPDSNVRAPTCSEVEEVKIEFVEVTTP